MSGRDKFVFLSLNMIGLNNFWVILIHHSIMLVLLVVEFQVHSVVNFVVCKCDLVLKYVVPLFQDNFLGLSSGLSSDKLFQVTNSVVLVALNADFFAEPIVNSNLDHSTVVNT